MKRTKKIILIGGGGHCISCINVIEETGLYEIKGILDLPDKVGKRLLGYPIIGTDDDLALYNDGNTVYCITVGQINAGECLRKKIFEKGKSIDAEFPVIISPNAYVSKHAKIAEGTVVLSGCIINAEAEIGQNCIINSGAIIEHGARIGSNCHISTSAVINGDCLIGSNCFIASGAILRNGLTIAENTLIGMGSVVTKDIPLPGIYMGNPLRKIV